MVGRTAWQFRRHKSVEHLKLSNMSCVHETRPSTPSRGGRCRLMNMNMQLKSGSGVLIFFFFVKL